MVARNLHGATDNKVIFRTIGIPPYIHASCTLGFFAGNSNGIFNDLRIATHGETTAIAHKNATCNAICVAILQELNTIVTDFSIAAHIEACIFYIHSARSIINSIIIIGNGSAIHIELTTLQRDSITSISNASSSNSVFGDGTAIHVKCAARHIHSRCTFGNETTVHIKYTSARHIHSCIINALTANSAVILGIAVA